MNKTYQRKRNVNIYRGFESRYPKYKETEMKMYISRNISSEIGKRTSVFLSQMIDGLSNELAKSKS